VAVWVSLLRGINLGARNKVNMPRLRDALTEAGFTEVRTLVQSGNVVASSRHRSADAVAKAVRAVVRESFDVDVPVIVRTPAQLRAVLDWNPFPEQAAKEPKLVHVVHLPKAPPAGAVKELLAADVAPDAVAARGREIVLCYAESMHASRLPKSKLVSSLTADGTARNWRTLSALVEMTG
jgi:uncharacterized protein (DUF1697 family)